MAKKKSKSKKAEKAEPAKKAPKKKKSNVAGWVIGAIIVIVIIIAIILLLRGCAKQPTEAPTAPAAQPTEAPAAAPAAGPEAVAQAPEEVRYCTISYAIGWPKNKLGTDVCKVDGNTVEAQIMFSGKGASLAGLWFKIITTDGQVQYLKDSREIKQNETLTYKVDVGKKIEDMIALPIISVDNVAKACLNQRLLVIKAESCVAG